jgi:integrase
MTAQKTKRATLKMLKRKLGHVPLLKLNALVLRDFIDMREAAGAGGVTIAADLSFLSGVLKWAYYSRHLNVPYHLALSARASLKHRKNMITRSKEREREPTDSELNALYGYWINNTRLKIDMPTLVRFALCTGMRLGEICRIRVEDINAVAKTVIIRNRKDPSKKLGNDQEVPLLPAAWKIVEEAVSTRKAGPIFGFNPSSVSASFTRTCLRLNIHDLHFHDIRHKATADFFRAGLDIPFVALMTGHKTWAMLRRYTSIKPSDVHRAYANCQAA